MRLDTTSVWQATPFVPDVPCRSFHDGVPPPGARRLLLSAPAVLGYGYGRRNCHNPGAIVAGCVLACVVPPICQLISEFFLQNCCCRIFPISPRVRGVVVSPIVECRVLWLCMSVLLKWAVPLQLQASEMEETTTADSRTPGTV